MDFKMDVYQTNGPKSVIFGGQNSDLIGLARYNKYDCPIVTHTTYSPKRLLSCFTKALTDSPISSQLWKSILIQNNVILDDIVFVIPKEKTDCFVVFLCCG